MNSSKQQKVARLIQQTMAEILQHGGIHLSPGAFVSVTEVQMSNNVREARIYVSTFHSTGATECFAALQEEWPLIHRRLGQLLSQQLRHIPKMVLCQDNTQAQAAHIDALLAKKVPNTDSSHL